MTKYKYMNRFHCKDIKSHVRLLIFMLPLLLSFYSCIPQKEIVLLQDLDDKKGYSNPFDELESITDKYILQANDYLFINVTTPDPKISEFFNQSRTSSGGGSQQNQNFFYYQIDDQMNIDFPYVGDINLKGCNVKMGKAKVQEALKPYLKEYNLTFKLASNTFTALGEFRNQGVINMNKEQVTIFEAVALAGGTTPFGKIKQLSIMRQTENGAVTHIVDLTDKNLINSEYYYIYPNDMLYVRPMKAKQFGIGESFSIGMITTVLALVITLQTFTK